MYHRQSTADDRELESRVVGDVVIIASSCNMQGVEKKKCLFRQLRHMMEAQKKKRKNKGKKLSLLEGEKGAKIRI